MEYNTLASQEALNKSVENLQKNNFQTTIVDTKEEALEKIKELIPQGSSVMNGASQTLEQIGFIEYLKSGNHGWENLHEVILAETDPIKKAELRKQSALSDYYLGSVHAISQSGEIVIASNTGSQLPSIAFTSPNVIFVVGAQKLTSTLEESLKRVESYVVPLENERMIKALGVGTMYSKTLILHKENPMMKRNVQVIFVKEQLGF